MLHILKTKATKEYESALMHVPSWLLNPTTILGGLLSISYALYILYTYPIIGGLFILFLMTMSGFYFANQNNKVFEGITDLSEEEFKSTKQIL